MKDDKVEIYNPTLQKQKQLQIPDDLTSGDADESKYLNDDGSISVTLNQKVILQRISKDLYQNPQAGIRELMANAIRAVVDAKEQFGAKKGRVDVTFTPSKREFIIHDIDALGMSKKVFLDIFRVLGNSGNFDPTKPGQFGMGFASYTTLSPSIVLETKARSTGEHYRTVGRDGLEFSKFIEVHDGDESAITEFGTKLTFVVYPEVNVVKLIDVIPEIARLAKCEINLHLTESMQGTHDWPLGQIRQKGVYKLAPNAIDEFFDGVVAKAGYKPNRKEIVRIENEDYEFYGLCMTDQGNSYLTLNGYTYSDIYKVYLAGIPVRSEFKVPKFSWWLLNIKNERKYPPMPNRDALYDKTVEAIQKILDEDFKEYFRKIKAHSVEELMQSPHRIILSNADEIFNDEVLSNYFDEMTRDVLQFLNSTYYEIDPEKQNATQRTFRFRYKVSDIPHVYFINNKNKPMINAVKSFDSKAIFITVKKGKRVDPTETERLVNYLKQFEINIAKDEIKRRKIKVARPDGKSVIDVVVHKNTNGMYEPIHVDEDDDLIDTKTIICEGDTLKAMISIVRRVISDMNVIRKDNYSEECTALTYKDFIEECEKTPIDTNKGKRTMLELINSHKGKNYQLLLTPLPAIQNNKSLINYLSEHEKTIAILGRNEIFKLHALAYAKTGNTSIIDYDSSGDKLKQESASLFNCSVSSLSPLMYSDVLENLENINDQVLKSIYTEACNQYSSLYYHGNTTEAAVFKPTFYALFAYIKSIEKTLKEPDVKNIVLRNFLVAQKILKSVNKIKATDSDSAEISTRLQKVITDSVQTVTSRMCKSASTSPIDRALVGQHLVLQPMFPDGDIKATATNRGEKNRFKYEITIPITKFKGIVVNDKFRADLKEKFKTISNIETLSMLSMNVEDENVKLVIGMTSYYYGYDDEDW